MKVHVPRVIIVEVVEGIHIPRRMHKKKGYNFGQVNGQREQVKGKVGEKGVA